MYMYSICMYRVSYIEVYSPCLCSHMVYVHTEWIGIQYMYVHTEWIGIQHAFMYIQDRYTACLHVHTG